MRILILCIALIASCSESSRCGPGTRAAGNACLPESTCPDGYLSQDGDCVAVVDGCGPRASEQNGTCVPDITDCGAGTHPEGDLCVADDSLPDVDVTESLDPTLPAEIVLPENGTLSLGGRVDTPEDLDGDSYVDPDYDDFVFHAAAGTWLRVQASSDDAALPAFLVVSASVGEDGRPLYMRYGVEPNDDVTRRELYLPRDDDYVLWVTDFAHLWPTIFGWPTVPIGGDAFTYRVVIENLGTPAPTPVTSLPFSASGDIADGSLRFYAVEPSEELAVLARSVGTPVDGINEVYSVLSAFGEDGVLVDEIQAGSASHDADLLLPGGHEHLLVQDHRLFIGPNRDFAVEVTAVEPVGCAADACRGTRSEDEVMLSWDLTAGDFLAVGVSHDSDYDLHMSVFDSALMPLLPSQSFSRYAAGEVALFAEDDRTVYLWVHEQKGSDMETFTVEPEVLATPLLTPDTPLTVEVAPLPDPVMPDSGIAHLVGSAGQVVLFDAPTTFGNGWTAPEESLLSSTLEQLGPATNALDADFASLTPLVAVLPADGHYLHVVREADADIAGSTYETRFAAVTPVPVEAGVSAAGALDAGLASLSYRGALWQRTTVEVVTDGFRPEIWVLNRGRVASLYPETYWGSDDTLTDLGLVARASGSSNTASLEHVSFAAEDLILVRDADGGPTGSFDITVQAYDAPDNDTCGTAELLDVPTGVVTVSSSSLGATDSLDLDWSNPCTNRPSQGPDRFYAIDVTAGESFDVSVVAEHAAVIYLFDACGGTCLAGASGDSQSFTWQAETDSRVIVGVDGYAPRSYGDFALEIARE